MWLSSCLQKEQATPLKVKKRARLKSWFGVSFCLQKEQQQKVSDPGNLLKKSKLLGM